MAGKDWLMGEWQEALETYLHRRPFSSRINGVFSTGTVVDLITVCRHGECLATGGWSHKEGEQEDEKLLPQPKSWLSTSLNYIATN